MHDGSVIHDEATKLGEVAATAKRIMYSVPEATEEDDMAGVSALMNVLPNKVLSKTKRSTTKKSRKKATKSTTRSRKGEKS